MPTIDLMMNNFVLHFIFYFSSDLKRVYDNLKRAKIYAVHLFQSTANPLNILKECFTI